MKLLLSILCLLCLAAVQPPQQGTSINLAWSQPTNGCPPSSFEIFTNDLTQQWTWFVSFPVAACTNSGLDATGTNWLYQSPGWQSTNQSLFFALKGSNAAGLSAWATAWKPTNQPASLLLVAATSKPITPTPLVKGGQLQVQLATASRKAASAAEAGPPMPPTP